VIDARDQLDCFETCPYYVPPHTHGSVPVVWPPWQRVVRELLLRFSCAFRQQRQNLPHHLQIQLELSVAGQLCALSQATLSTSSHPQLLAVSSFLLLRAGAPFLILRRFSIRPYWVSTRMICQQQELQASKLTNKYFSLLQKGTQLNFQFEIDQLKYFAERTRSQWTWFARVAQTGGHHCERCLSAMQTAKWHCQHTMNKVLIWSGHCALQYSWLLRRAVQPVSQKRSPRDMWWYQGWLKYFPLV